MIKKVTIGTNDIKLCVGTNEGTKLSRIQWTQTMQWNQTLSDPKLEQSSAVTTGTKSCER